MSLLVWPVAIGRAQTGAGQEALPTLETGRTIERLLSGGEVHNFQLALAAGQRLRLTAIQRGIDLSIKIAALNGSPLVEMDNLGGTQGPEIASIIADRAESFRVEIRAPGKGVPAGRYLLRLDIAGVADQDRRWIEAQRAYVEGRKLRAQPNAEAQTRALAQFEAAFGLWQSLDDKSMAAHALYYLADGNRRLGRLRQSLSFFDQARQLALEAGEDREAATAEIYIAMLHSELGEPRKAIERYERLLPQWQAINDVYGEARTLLNLGLAYAMLGEARKALETYDPALRIWRKLDNRQQTADALNNIGGAYELLGEWQKALEHYDRSLAIYQALGNRRGEAQALNNLGYIYEFLNESLKGLEYYERALSGWRALGDRKQEAWTIMNCGVAYARMNAPQKALECYQQALGLQQAGKDRRAEGVTLLQMGDLHASSDPQKALECYDRSLPLLRAAGDRWREALALRGLGSLYLSLNDLPRAQDCLNRALGLYRDLEARSGEAQTLYGLARLERERGDFAAARRQIQSAVAIAERMRADVGSQQMRASYFASAQKFYELEIDVLMRLHQAHPAEGFDVLAAQSSERARARNLLDLLAESRADLRQDADPALLERERELKQLLHAKATRQLLLDANSLQFAALKLEISQLENDYEQVQAGIRKTSPHYAALVQPQPLTPAEIQSQLDDDTLLLEYHLGEERSWLWAITNRRLESHQLPKREQLESAAAQFHRLLTARSLVGKGETPRMRRRRIAQADARQPGAAERLSAMILAPAAARLAGKRLLIVPDGALQYIAFAALPAPGSGRKNSFRPLMVDHEIVILPSASSAVTHRRELAGRPKPPKLLAVLADPVFHLEDERVGTKVRQAAAQEPPVVEPSSARSIEHLPEDAFDGFARKIPRLPFTRQEAARILALAPAAATFKATGFEASRAAALNPELGQYRYLHFATHGLLDSRRPGLSGLALSLVDQDGQPQNGFLRANDIYNLKLSAELVVLSACQTGLGKAVQGEGLVGLTRGFMYAGAARVVVSLWNVNDRATSELMARFYRKMLKENQPPAAALRAAQGELQRQRAWRAPYYWAAFVLQGEWK